MLFDSLQNIIFVLPADATQVNVLFTQQSRDIGKSVTKLTANDLQQYSVLKDSALEKVWARLGKLPRG